MADTNFGDTMEALFKGMDSFITSKTVVGDAVRFDDGTIVLPLVDVSFGVGAGAFEGNEKNKTTGKSSGGGGLGAKIQPSAVLVIKNGSSKLINVKNQAGLTKVLDMVPDFVDKFSDKFGSTSDSGENDDANENIEEI